MKGIVAFAFAQRPEPLEPNPCNIRLGGAVEHIAAEEGGKVVIVSQWEISRFLRSRGYEPAHSVELRPEGTYLDSEGVWSEAKAVLERWGITEVIPVAQPFLQMRKVKRMIQADGFTVVDRPVGFIGFDKRSDQPWARRRLQLLAYAVRQALFGTHGHHGKQVAS